MFTSEAYNTCITRLKRIFLQKYNILWGCKYVMCMMNLLYQEFFYIIFYLN